MGNGQGTVGMNTQLLDRGFHELFDSPHPLRCYEGLQTLLGLCVPARTSAESDNPSRARDHYGGIAVLKVEGATGCISC